MIFTGQMTKPTVSKHWRNTAVGLITTITSHELIHLRIILANYALYSNAYYTCIFTVIVCILPDETYALTGDFVGFKLALLL